MTETEKLKSIFTNGLGSSRLREIFSILEEANLKPLGKSNTDTLLYQYKTSTGEVLDIFAFRFGPAILSFPQSYWQLHKLDLSNYLSKFTYTEKPVLEGFISTSQFSAGQIEITRNTLDRILVICKSVCSNI